MAAGSATVDFPRIAQHGIMIGGQAETPTETE
jgi:hypothetical protein